MKNYYVNVYAFMPYKREYDLRVKGSREAIAIKRAVDLFRQFPQVKGRQIKELFVKCTRL